MPANPKPPTAADRKKERQVEQYAPPLLLALMGIRRPPKEDVAKWAAWCKADLAKRRWLEYGELLGQGSWNHLWMLAACALWMGWPVAQSWWWCLLSCQVNEITRGREEAILGCLHGTEPLSHYEMMRWGSVLGVRAWAQCEQDAELLRLTARYSEVNAALLSLFAVPWPDPVERRGGRGQLTYDGPEVAAVGERNGSHKVSALGPLLALAIGWACVLRDAAKDWAVEIALRLGGGPLGRQAVSLPLQEAIQDWIIDRDREALGHLQAALAGIHFAPGREMHAWIYPNALAVFDPERNNGNTPPVLASLQVRGETVRVLRPFQEGRASGDTAPGRCEAVPSTPGWVLVATGSQGEQRLELPPGEPLLRLSFGGNGLEVHG